MRSRMVWLGSLAAITIIALACGSFESQPPTEASDGGTESAPFVDAATDSEVADAGGDAGRRIVDVVAGDTVACALRSDGTVVCWGRNQEGQAGQPDDAKDDVCDKGIKCRIKPQTVPDLDDVVQLSAGRKTVCALRRDKSVWCWGSNEHAQLGTGATNNPPQRAKPQPVANLPLIEEIVLGFSTACARTVTNEIFCWGANHGGLLTTTNTFGTEPPAVRPLLSNAKQIALSLEDPYGCFIRRSDDKLECWGRSYQGS